ncbi:putative periplasmic serine endoprotease DegP-like precursor [Anatilimnocola aggregata]|uniref:Putative periplasmic serine endoprotease DegP-like n=1 Tax=Anatilimnocola aggregata TaxID=2528021 RepID=A0A517YLG8_9BACT|nr:trypsin-like peptidase domain-containing protein [Anatilimnocola aggregata]QDU31050.1 putative periplasmic serine endoprotease DegP-like precursor [Anatilimnocola aggregata]
MPVNNPRLNQLDRQLSASVAGQRTANRRRWLQGFSVACAAAVLGSSALSPLAPNIQASENRFTPLVRAIEAAKPSVVNIHGRKTVRAENASFGSDGMKQVNGMGTGIVFDPRGYILTNYHVVEGVSNIQVSMHNDRQAVAKLIAHDPKTDLAVIKIESDGPLKAVQFGTSCDLLTAEPVVAMGNAYGYEYTVTQGIISALHRTVQVSDEQKYQDLIQTDASINPGNSGGPLFNVDGDVIGINVAVRVGAQGIGFAIPIDEALDVAARLMSIERLEQQSHGIVGKTKCEPTQRTFVVSSVRRDSPGEVAALQAGDVITAIGERKIERALDIELALLGRKRTEDLPIEVLRSGNRLTTNIVLAPANGRGGKVALADRVWENLGLRLAPMDDTEFKTLNSRYRGGLAVQAVRPDSPASAQGIRRGDVLVGMHVWETVSLDNVSYVLDREDVNRQEPVLFYILRGSDTLYGHLRFAERTR